MKTWTSYRFLKEWPLTPSNRPGGWLKINRRGRGWDDFLNSYEPFQAFRDRTGSAFAFIECAGEEVQNKVIIREMRMIRLYGRKHVLALGGLAACFVLQHYEASFSDDRSPRKALLSLIDYLNGKPTDLHLAFLEADHASRFSVVGSAGAAAKVCAIATLAAFRNMDAAICRLIAQALQLASTIVDTSWKDPDSVYFDAHAHFTHAFNKEAVKLLTAKETSLGKRLMALIPKELRK